MKLSEVYEWVQKMRSIGYSTAQIETNFELLMINLNES